MVHFCFKITDIWWLHFIDVGTFLKTSACWLLKNVQKKFSSIRFLQDCSCFWKDIFKEDFRDNLGIENLLKDFEIDPIKPPLLAQVLIKSVLMEVY